MPLVTTSLLSKSSECKTGHRPIRVVTCFSIMLIFLLFLSVIVIAGLAVVPDALALHGAAVFLTVASLDECPAASLAEGNVGLAAIIIQSTGVYGSEAAQCKIRSIDRRMNVSLF